MTQPPARTGMRACTCPIVRPYRAQVLDSLVGSRPPNPDMFPSQLLVFVSCPLIRDVQEADKVDHLGANKDSGIDGRAAG